MAELTWSAEELVAELGISEHLIRRHLDEIPHLIIGQRVFFPKAAIRRWLEERPLVDLGLIAPATALVPSGGPLSATPGGTNGAAGGLGRGGATPPAAPSGPGARTGPPAPGPELSRKPGGGVAPPPQTGPQQHDDRKRRPSNVPA